MDDHPQSMEDVERLVHSMYNVRDPQEVSRIQEQLQTLQRSEDGWRLADALLSSKDATSRFFGALTFTVKLNVAGPTLSEADAQSILQMLISWVVKLATLEDSRLALGKLTTTLVTYFVRVSNLWKRPLLHLFQAFSGGNPTADVIDISQYTTQQLTVLLNFAEELATELDRALYNGPAQARLHQELEHDTPAVSVLISSVLSGQDSKIREAALKTYQAWTLYAHANLAGRHDAVEVLQKLTDLVLGCLVDPSTEEHALHVFTDLLETNTAFFRSHQFDTISHIIQSHIAPRFKNGNADEGQELLYAQFIVAFGNAVMEDIVEQPQGARSQAILGLIASILSSDGVPGDTDEVSSLTIDFWCTYCEHVTDFVGSWSGRTADIPWLPHTLSVMLDTCRALWKKMWLPPAEVIKLWQDDELAAFRSFRSNVEELFNFMHVTLELRLTNELVDICLTAIDQRQWIATEAAVVLLGALADSVLENETGDEPLRRLFQSSLLRDVTDPDQNMPSQVRKAAISLIGAYGSFIKRNTQFLPDAVRFLFAALEHATLAGVAARAIQDLCSTCRTSLVPELNGFLAQYSSLEALPHIEPYIKEKVIGGVAAIVQALPDDDLKLEPLLVLLNYVDKDVKAARDAWSAGSNDVAITAGMSALHCLSSMGKALQTPEDIPFDLDNDNDAVRSTYWIAGRGKLAQDRIVACLSILDILGGYSEAIDAVCQVLKTGYKEIQPGPFVLPPSVTCDFLASCNVKTPQVESVLLASALVITQHSQSTAPRIPDTAKAIFSLATRFMHDLTHPRLDPSIAHGCVEIVAHMIPVYTEIMLDTADLQTALRFTLQAIENVDLLPKRAALDFWNRLIQASSPTRFMPGLDQEAQVKAAALMAVVGQDVTQVLVRQVAGIGRRSDLDHANEPIKSLFAGLPAQAKDWFEVALFSTAFPPVSSTVGEAEKRRFLSQLAGLRGGARTKDVIKNFYAVCRGTVSSYS